MFAKAKTKMDAWTTPMAPETIDLEALAVAATPAAAARLPALKDVRGYSFECRRFGDFLSVYIQRGAEKHTSAIQLMKARDRPNREPRRG